ncbi:MAG: hypothetical protein HRU41_15105 [Saprospiraceae bacterium]|nr:hypothetical protein [Saprospiraceae bacterium]
MRALIVAFYVVVGLFLISTMIYLAQSEDSTQPKLKKELVVDHYPKR